MNSKVLKVLLIEDFLIAQIAAKLNLTELCCQVDVAATGVEALQLTSKNSYDIILMDIGLADMDGYEITEKIRCQNGKNDHTTIIALTAHSEDNIIKHCKEVGMNDFVNKPLSIETARKVISDFKNKN